MNQRKPNKIRWYALALTVLLAVGCLVMSVGVTWARYRTDMSAGIFFQARKPLAVRLGITSVNEDGNIVFVPTDQHSWAQANGKLYLDFAMANGISVEEFEAEDQRFHIRLLGSLGAWSGEETAAITLMIPPALEEAREETDEPTQDGTTGEIPAEPVAVPTVAGQIQPNTQLWTEFGDGWEFRFLDPQTGKELVWSLEGGKLSCLELELVIEGGTLADTSLLQLQMVRVSGE